MEDLSKNMIATLRESLLVLDFDLRVRTANSDFYRTFQIPHEEVENCYLYESGNGQWNIPELRAELNEIAQDHEALREIKADSLLRRIPVLILTTSRAEEDIVRSYDLSVNTFISNPITFKGLVDVMKTIGKYWIEISTIPLLLEDL